MSFRYTTELIGLMKHRLCLEQTSRQLQSQTFTGTCGLIKVLWSSYGTLLRIEAIESSEGSKNPGEKYQFYRNPETNTWDWEHISMDIRGAIWNAKCQLDSAKDEAVRQSLAQNFELKSQGNFSDWFSEDASTMRPFAFDAVRYEGVPEWIKAIQRGEKNIELPSGDSDSANSPGERKITSASFNIEDIPIGSIDPLLTPALMLLEDDEYIQSQYNLEMARDEQHFWERADLIRQAQSATVGDFEKRRPYKYQGAFVTEEAAKGPIFGASGAESMDQPLNGKAEDITLRFTSP